jgi:hypothetical protein
MKNNIRALPGRTAEVSAMDTSNRVPSTKTKKPKPVLPPIPAPETRVSVDLYLQARSWLLEHDPDGIEILEWSNTVAVPQTPEAMAAEIVWIILCAGRKAQAARTICSRVWEAIHAGQPVASVFRYLKKAAAIERAWHERVNDFAMLQEVLQQNDELKLLEWCRSIPFIGEDTQYQ